MSEHPEVCFSMVKEPHFFSTDVGVGFRFDEDTYYSFFREASGDTPVVMEGSTKYLYSREAVPRIERELPGGKYIVMLRNPVDMAQALHWQYYRSGYIEDIRDFQEAWKAQEQRRHGALIPRLCRAPDTLQYQEYCMLGKQLQRLYQHVPRERVMVILLEEMKRNPREIWLKLQSFLGISDDGRTDFPVINAAGSAQSRWRKKLKWRCVFFWLDFVKFAHLSSFGVRLFNKYQLITWNRHARRKSKPAVNRPAVSPEVKQELIETFRDDVNLLGDLIDRDVSHWLK